MADRLPPSAIDTINAAIDEVMTAYDDADFKFDGVLDIGDELYALGLLVERNLIAEARELYSETHDA